MQHSCTAFTVLLCLRAGPRGHELRQKRMQLVLGMHTELQRIHQRDPCLRHLGNPLGAVSRVAVPRGSMLDGSRHADGEAMQRTRVVHLNQIESAAEQPRRIHRAQCVRGSAS